MKKFGLVFAIALVLGTMALTSCSSKQSKAEEPVISGSAGAADTSAVDANLGSGSSGQGR